VSVVAFLNIFCEEWCPVLWKSLEFHESATCRRKFMNMSSSTFSYAPLSTETTFSTPETFEASSATDLIFGPATKAVIDPPSFCAAVTAPNDAGISLPSFCSRIANDDSSRASAESEATGVIVLDCVRTWRSAVCPILEIIVVV